MTQLPAQCMSCGHEFTQEAFDFPGSVGISMVGNMVSCPRCGALARVAEGTFNARGVVAELVSGPPWTNELLQRLQTATERAQTLATDDPEGAIEAIASVAPSLRQKAWAAAGSGQLANFIALLVLVLQVISTWEGEGPPGSEDVDQIVKIVVENSDNTQIEIDLGDR